MEQRQLGKTGIAVTVLGFGGAEIGYENASFDDVERLLNGALDSGLNLIDTAECYMASEEMIGRSVGYRRSDYSLFTKCGHASGLPQPDWSPELIERQIDRSLERLRTDHVDLLQLHSCSKQVLEQGDVIAALERARSAGKTRFIGYSGDSEDALYAVQSGIFDTLQTSLNIADQQVLKETLPMAVEKSMGVIAKRPIANAAWKSGTKPTNSYHHEYWDRLQQLQYEFLRDTALNETVSIALRFTLTTPGVATAIVGTKSPDRWLTNAQLVATGPLDPALYHHIRTRWSDVAQPDWVGQV